MSVVISKEQITDWEDKTGSALLAAGDSNTSIVNFVTKNARRFFIAFFGQSWDAGGDTFVTFWLEVNDSIVYQFQPSSIQIAPPEQPTQEITPWIEVPQQSRVRMRASLASGASGSQNVFGRIRGYYAPLDVPPL